MESSVNKELEEDEHSEISSVSKEERKLLKKQKKEEKIALKAKKKEAQESEPNKKKTKIKNPFKGEKKFFTSQLKQPNRNYVRARIPIPLPGTSIRFQEHIRTHYTGIFQGYAVWITNPIEAIDLFDSGSYGKGIFSRSKPDFNERLSRKDIEDNIIADVRTPKRMKQEKEEEKKIDEPKNDQDVDTKEEKQVKKPKMPKRTDGFHRKRMAQSDASVEEHLQVQVNEFLQLGLEEAFFLQHALHCLKIVTDEGEELSMNEAWKLFHQIEPHFKFSYACYHYFRTKGLAPKYGLKYGVDWVLYRKGPSLFHAERAIVMNVINAETRKPLDLKPAQRSLSWLNLLNINRVSEQVRKGLVLCFIHVPSTIDQLASPDEFLGQLSIQETAMSRWIPTQTREIIDAPVYGVASKE